LGQSGALLLLVSSAALHVLVLTSSKDILSMRLHRLLYFRARQKESSMGFGFCATMVGKKTRRDKMEISL